MIITGYQGIGKSTISKIDKNIIDLESSCFWKVEDGMRKRSDDWYIYYCQMAIYLSKQGYIVFVSCHPEIRKFLSEHWKAGYKFCAIFPSKDLKTQWINKLQNRYYITESEKDLRAYEHAFKNYDSDIDTLYAEYRDGYFDNVKIIEHIDYKLHELITDICLNSKNK